jgi:hypothetical protein
MPTLSRNRSIMALPSRPVPSTRRSGGGGPNARFFDPFIVGRWHYNNFGLTLAKHATSPVTLSAPMCL